MKLLPLLSLVLTLSACQREGVTAPPAATASTATASETTTPTEASANAIPFSVTPPAMSQCDPAVEATIIWDASSLPEITSVEIWVSDGADFKLFAAGGGKGEAKTGPWTRPGSRFQARDSANGRVLASLQVAGPKC